MPAADRHWVGSESIREKNKAIISKGADVQQDSFLDMRTDELSCSDIRPECVRLGSTRDALE